MSDVQVRLVCITSADQDPALLESVYVEVLRPSFSDDELPSIEVVSDGLHGEGFNLVLVATSATGRAVGAAVYSEGGSEVGILSYLAIRPGERGRGVGAQMLVHLASVWEGRPVQVVLGEVHDPRFYPETEGDRSVARLRFYERSGARLLDVPWMQPRLSRQSARVGNMLLLTFHLGAEAEARHEVSSASVAAFAERYYVDEEGEVPADGAYRALLARLTERPAIGVRSIADLEDLVPLVVPAAAGDG